jgi:hypothetical protein
MASDPKHPLRITSPADGDNGPTYSYRGSVIVTNKQETNCSFSLQSFPHGPKGRWGGIGGVAVILRLVDAWLDTGRLPAPYVMPETKSPAG